MYRLIIDNYLKEIGIPEQAVQVIDTLFPNYVFNHVLNNKIDGDCLISILDSGVERKMIYYVEKNQLKLHVGAIRNGAQIEISEITIWSKPNANDVYGL